jgi:hypothetical protein
MVLAAASGEAPLAPGVPPVGASLTNHHGLEFTVLEHTTIPSRGKRFEPSGVPGHSLDRIVAEPVRIEVPVVSIGGLSGRLFTLLSEFDGISPKTIAFVDTQPAGLAHGMHFGGHSFNWQFHPEVAFLTIHSPDTTEDVLAHELMHGWLDLVMGYEDDRIYRDHDDHAAMFLVNSTQCIVLDCMVQDAIGARGFDPCFWTGDVVSSLYDSGVVLTHGVYPATAYEASFLAKHYALPGAVPHLFRLDADLARKYIMGRNMIQETMPELAHLGDEIARAFHEGSYRTREDARRLIDRCLLLTAEYVGMDLDLERDLEEVPSPEPTWTDKFPEMFPGWPPQLKYEVHRRLLREDWPAGTEVEASARSGSTSVHVTFYPPSRSRQASPPATWEWQSPQPLALPRSSHRVHEDALLGASPAARFRPKSWELLEMGATQPPSVGASHPVPQQPATGPGAYRESVKPAIPELPGVPAHPDVRDGVLRPSSPTIAGHTIPHPHADDVRIPKSRKGGPTMRHYLPGLGRFMSRVRLHEAVALGRTTYRELRDTWGINIGPLGTSEAFGGNRTPEHAYTYAENNPVNRIDPSGLQSCQHGPSCQQHRASCPTHGYTAAATGGGTTGGMGPRAGGAASASGSGGTNGGQWHGNLNPPPWSEGCGWPMGRVVCSCPKSNGWMCVAHTKVGPPIVGAPGAALGIYKQNWVDNLSCSCHAEGDPCSGEEHQRVIQGDKILKSRNEPFQGWCVRRSNWTSGNWRGGGAGAGMGPSGGMGGGIGGGVIRGGGGGGMGPILRGGYTPGGPVGPPTYQPPGPPPSPWQYFGHNPMAGNQPPAELPVLPPGAYYVGLPPASQAPNIPAYPPGTPGMRAPYPWETAPTPEGYWSFDWVKFAECFAAAV